MKPRLLETHGCQGGAHAGYVRAGWDVTGVDINKAHACYYPGKLIIGDAATGGGVITPFQAALHDDGWCCPCCPVCELEDQVEEGYE